MSSRTNRKINIIDVIIVAVIAAAVIAAALISGAKPAEEETLSDKKLVTLEITEKHTGFSENVVIGDNVTEKVEKKQIGTVVGVTSKPSEKNSYDRITGEPISVLIPEREDVYVTMELNSSEEVAVGKQLSIITKHFAGHGYVTAIEEGAAK